MTKLALSVAAMVLASSAAFAGSDHFGADNQPVASVDTNATASIPYAAPVDTRVTTGPTRPATKTDADEPGQGIWGR